MDLDTIIVSHNHGKYLKDCLLSISYSLKTNLILLINNPKDKESIKIAQKFPKIKILINKKPKG